MLDRAEEHRFRDPSLELPCPVGHDRKALGPGQQDRPLAGGEGAGALHVERGAAGAHAEEPGTELSLDLHRQEIGLAGEGGDVAFDGPLIDLARRRELGDPAVLHHGDLVGDRHRLRLVVGDVEGRRAARLLHVADQPAHVVAQAGIEIGERLVEQQQPRLDDERARQRHALLLAAGELARQAMLEPAKLDLIENLADAAASLVAPAFAKQQAVADVVHHAEMGEQRVVLEDDAEVALVRWRGQDADAVRANVAAVGVDEPRDAAQRRRLAAAGRTKQADELALPGRQAHLVESDGLAVALAQRMQLDVAHSAARWPWTRRWRDRE